MFKIQFLAWDRNKYVEGQTGLLVIYKLYPYEFPEIPIFSKILCQACRITFQKNTVYLKK